MTDVCRPKPRLVCVIGESWTRGPFQSDPELVTGDVSQRTGLGRTKGGVLKGRIVNHPLNSGKGAPENFVFIRVPVSPTGDSGTVSTEKTSHSDH